MQDSVNQPGFLFHDYETFGTSPSLDRPAQLPARRPRGPREQQMDFAGSGQHGVRFGPLAAQLQVALIA
ncbi:hypothetical protein M8371_30840, partial [Klebsiella pneumoniae]|nr:hypothetical protein [Klebsiella pneumoniae]